MSSSPGEAVPADDPGLLYGEALFETMRVQGGAIWWLDRHLGRLRASATALGWTGIPVERALRAALAAALADDDGGASRLRLTATNGGRAVTARDELPVARSPRAITLPGAWSPGARIAEHKTTSYAAYRLAQARADAAGAGHAILADPAGAPGETASASIFAVIGGALVTPPIRGILPGVGRSVVIERLRAEVREVSAAELRGAEEVFAVSALRGAMPITAIDDRPVGAGEPGLFVGLANVSLMRSGIEEASVP